MTEIINQLHNLSGDTIGAIFHSLNRYIKAHDEEIKTNLAYIFANFIPRSDLEKLVVIRLIDHYKCSDKIVDIFKSEDEFYISHALQCSWFFRNFNSDPKCFADLVFPCMSFSTRMKVLKRYSKQLKNTAVAESLFIHLKARYGLNTAYVLLPACSELFIKEVLEKTSIQVPSPTLILLFNLYPSVVVSYLTYLLDCHLTNKRVFRTFNLYIYERIFGLLAAREPLKFAVLMEKYHSSLPYLKLGKRATRHFVLAAFDSLQQHVMLYKRIVVWKNVISCLNFDQVASLQLAILPSTVSDFIQSYNDYCEFVSITVSMKDSLKQNILLTNFNKAYGKPITDYLEALTFELVQKLPQNIAEKWIELKLPTIENQYLRGDYVKFLPPEKALPRLKKMIESQSDVNLRAHYVHCLISLIIINDDVHLVKPLCEYAVKRLRNNRSSVKEKIIIGLTSYKNLINIPDESWIPIEELLNIMLLNDETNLCKNEIIDLMSIQIHSRLKRGLPVLDQLDKLLKFTNDYYKFDLCHNSPFEKQCLMWFLERLPGKKQQADLKKNEVPESLVKLFSRLCEWNGLHPNERIDIPSWMMEQIVKIFTNEHSFHFWKSAVLSAVRKDKKLKYEFYNQIFPRFFDPFILIYKLSYEPLKVKENYSDILKIVLDQVMTSYNLFFRKARLYAPFGIPELFCNYCLKILREKHCEDYSTHTSLRNSVHVLSLMLPTSEFVEIISEYYPKQSTVEDYSDEGRCILEIQKEIAACFKSVNCPSAILESVNKFAIGDYLKLVVGSIHSICLRSPEHKILPLLLQWLNSPVSVRKHFIRAYFKISPIQNTLEMIVGLFENEKNSSIRLLLFEHSLRFFIMEPSSETFLVLKAVIEKLQSSDETAINKLFDIENVPDEFISEYLQLLWDVVSLKNEALIKENKNKIINLIEPDILRSLNEDFCDVLISQVFDHEEVFPMDLKLFAVRYLLYSQGLEQLNGRLEKVMIGIEKLLTKWNDFDLKAVYVFPSRNTLSFVIDSLIRESFIIDSKALSPVDLIMKFKKGLLTHLKECDILEELLSLDLSTFFHTTPDNLETMFLLSNFLEPLVHNITSVYGDTVVDSIWSPITKIFKWKYSDDILQKKMLDISEFLLKKSSKNCQLLGLKMLPTVITSDIQRYKEILNIIFQNPDVTIKIFANKLYKDLSSSVKVE